MFTSAAGPWARWRLLCGLAGEGWVDVDRGQPPLLEGPAQQPLCILKSRRPEAPLARLVSLLQAHLMKHLFRDKLLEDGILDWEERRVGEWAG